MANVKRTIAAVFVACLCSFLAVSPAFSQLSSGSVFGSVRDASGAVIPGATVVLISASRGTTLETTTNENGDFTFPNALGDTYTVRVTMDGFKALERPNVPVSPGERVVVPALVIELGALNETITVTGEAPMIQSSSGERSFTVTSEAVANLPLANRGYSQLASLTPGVSGTSRLGGGGQNNVMQDGVSTMDTGSNGGNGMLQMNSDAVSEVRVLSQGYQAEFGRSSGLQISAVSKSGTNQFRGSGYDIERSSDWNANTWANVQNGDPKVLNRQRDFGYTIGGPIGKPGGENKLFFFLSHEFRPRTDGGDINRFRVPTVLERRGDFSQSRDNNGALFNLIRDASTGLPCAAADTRGCFQDGGVVGRIPQNRLYETGLNILKLWPEPNASGINYNYEATQPVDKRLTQQTLLRIDYNLSNKMRVMGKYAGQLNTVKPSPGSIPGFNDTLQPFPFVHHGVVTVDYTLGRTTFLEGTWGIIQNRLGSPIVTEKANRNLSGIGAIPFLYPDALEVDPRYHVYDIMEGMNPTPPMWNNGTLMLMPTFLWGQRITNSGNRTATGAPGPPSLLFPSFVNINRTYDVSIAMTKLADRHTIKGGFYLNHSRKNQTLGVQGSFNFWGTVDFGQDTANPLDTGFGFANAATGVFSSYAQQSKMIEGKYLYNNIEGYIQDNWKVTSQLTLDYGVRFTRQQPQYDAFLQSSNFFPDEWSLSQAPRLYLAGCPNNAATCAANARQARDPQTGQLLGPNTTAAIGAIIPGSGNTLNGIKQAGQGIAKENYVWPNLMLAPRFGAAYDLRGDQKIVVRGGMGLFFDRPEGNSVYNQVANPPYSQASTVRYAQLQTLGQGGLATQTPPQLFIFTYDADVPSSVQWQAGTQIALPWSSALDLSYVGQHGFNLLRSQDGTPTGANAQDLNAVDFGAAYLPQNQDPSLPASSIPGARANTPDALRPFRGFSAINVQWPRNWDEFHSIQASLNRRFRNGLQFGLNYTLGLSYEGNVITPLRLQHAADGSFSFRADQAEQDELLKDMGLRAHTIKGSFVWDMPDMDRSGGALSKTLASIANDWQLSGIFTGGSAARYDISYSYQSAGENINITGSPSYAGRTRIVGDTGSGCSSNQYSQFNGNAFAGPQYGSVGLESGRNYLVGCPDKTVDLAIARNFRLGSTRAAQIRFDIFNAFNTVVYNARQTQLQLTNPTDQVIRNAQLNADGSVNQARLRPRDAGFGAVTGAQGMRSVQLQLRFQF
jgi:hypothetical protein